MNSVITRLNGGLGNQLFQYATGLALARKLGARLKIDITEFETYHLRRFELGRLPIQASVATTADVAGVIINPSRLQRNLNRIAIRLHLDNGKAAFKEIHYHYDPLFEQIRHPVYLNGYWQSEKYFQSVASQLRNELQFNDIPDQANLDALQLIQSSISVSLHIRRGDYVSNASATAVHGLCSLDYYNAAIRYFAERINSPTFFVFSDDLQWAKDHLKMPHPVHFVDANGPDRGIEDMWLMKSCQHHITANSSFSWWAAWLNQQPGKIVVAPRTWFRDPSFNCEDLIPALWHKL
jgi:hypothetical protein